MGGSGPATVGPRRHRPLSAFRGVARQTDRGVAPGAGGGRERELRARAVYETLPARPVSIDAGTRPEDAWPAGQAPEDLARHDCRIGKSTIAEGEGAGRSLSRPRR